MIKTISIIILCNFWSSIFILVNALKRKLDILIEEDKEKNQIILINLLNSFFLNQYSFDKSKLNPPLAKIPLSFL